MFCICGLAAVLQHAIVIAYCSGDPNGGGADSGGEARRKAGRAALQRAASAGPPGDRNRLDAAADAAAEAAWCGGMEPDRAMEGSSCSIEGAGSCPL